MASTQKRVHQRRLRTNWFLTCFGFGQNPATGLEKKGRKTGGRKKWFRICLPKIRIIGIRKRKVSFDTKKAALKATTQSIILEASKVQQLKLQNHATNTHLKEKEIVKESIHVDNKDQNDQSNNGDTSHKAKPLEGPVPRGKECLFTTRVTRDSFIGVSIMMLTLIIMSIWGRMYAILCMSAWFYCVPLLRADRNVNVVSNENSKPGFDSELIKKKVVSQPRLLKDHEVAKNGLS